MLPGVGDINAKNLIAYCGSAEAVFAEKKSSLEKNNFFEHKIFTKNDNFLHKNAICTQPPENAF